MKIIQSSKIKLVGITASAVVLGLLIFQTTILADGGEQTTPGSTVDPVVTKSYVDQKIAEAMGKTPADPTTGGGGAVTALDLEVVKVPVGQTLIVAAGGELIVRTGKAVAFSPDTNGLSDMTDGKDIAPGKPVGNNHLILFPREGRGVKHAPTSKTEMILLVRGGYQVQ